jgi:hypothetical protein
MKKRQMLQSHPRDMEFNDSRFLAMILLHAKSSEVRPQLIR